MRVILLSLLLFAGSVQAEIYKCVEDDGRVTYSNVQSKGCSRLNVGPPNTVPPPKSAGSGSSRTATPGDFPRVDPDTQRSRDDERRKILDRELANEQSALDVARKNLVEQESQVMSGERNIGGRGINGAKVDERVQPYRDRVALHERNIEALRKEIANLR